MKRLHLSILFVLLFLFSELNAQIVFTEIMYNPPEAGQDSLEFIELYNTSAENINLKGFYFSEGIEFVFPDVTMQGHSYLVVCINSSAFSDIYGFDALQWSGGALSNGGEDIELRDSLENISDYINYDDRTPWDNLADGAGSSLELCDEPSIENDSAYQWVASANELNIMINNAVLKASPGVANQTPCDSTLSAVNEKYHLFIKGIEVFPSFVTDVIQIQNNTNFDILSIELINSQGRFSQMLAINNSAYSLSNLTTGYYYLRINVDNQFIVKRFYKQ